MRLEQIVKVLSLVEKGVRKASHIEKKAHILKSRTYSILRFLWDTGRISRNGSLDYQITDKGRQYLEDISSYLDELENY